MRAIAVCADDYGLSPAVSAGIRELAEAGRISATSAMTVFPEWPWEAERIRPLADRIEVGLHLTLTDAAPLGAMPRLAPSGRLPALGALLARAHLASLPREEVRMELERQLNAFEAALGRPPRFVDGHQHVHVLPGVREAVLGLFGERLDPSRTWLRVCTSPVGAIRARGVAVPRALLIDRLSRPIGRAARARGLVVNDDFRGVSALVAGDVATEFEAFMTGPGERPLMMCHPGRVDAALLARDPVHARREVELDYLGGPGFASALAARGLVVRPLLPRPSRDDP